MWPLNAHRLKMGMRVNQSAERELQMEMAVGQDRQNGERYSTNRRGWFSKMVCCRFAPGNMFRSHGSQSSRKASSPNMKPDNFFKCG